MGVIIGTAGHIDHGKTSLVKALTGQDTDRLKEEKERGISIDLGFAYLDLPDGSRAGIVDVPGHERFIRNMLAGAHGIDILLFTVAADDGVMPQTEEHFDIAHLLQVRRMIFVLTKVDLVSPARRRAVEAEVAALAAGTAFEKAPVVPFSSVTGEGLDEIRARIAAVAGEGWPRRAAGHFRMPIDRVFVLKGHGIVVTGTAIGGEVRAGDRVRCLPGEELMRVRSVQVHNEPVPVATAGQRVALNLSGAERAALARGDVVCAEAVTRTCGRFDASVEVRPAAGAGLKDRQRVRVHVGTAERIATVRVLQPSATLKPHQTGYCRIALADPVLVLRGDRFIIRDETAHRTIGGGAIVHPWPPAGKRTDSETVRALTALHGGDAASVVQAFLEMADDFAVPASVLSEFMNMRLDDTTALLDRLGNVRAFEVDGERIYTTAAKLRRAADELVGTLRRFHAANPLAPGMDVEAGRGGMSVRLFRAVLDQLAADGVVVREASLLRLPSHAVRLSGEEQELLDRIGAVLTREPAAPPSVAEIEGRITAQRVRIAEVLRVMERQRRVIKVAPDLYFDADYLLTVEQLLRERWQDAAEITPAAFRDAIGTTRKYAIPLLEYFDRKGVTERTKAGRRLRAADQRHPARAGSEAATQESCESSLERKS